MNFNMEFIFENEIKRIVKDEFLKENYHSELVTLYISSFGQDFRLDENSEYILVSKSIDIDFWTTITIQSSNNFFKTTKLLYEETEGLSANSFRGHNLRIFAGTSAPFNLYFLKITPY